MPFKITYFISTYNTTNILLWYNIMMIGNFKFPYVIHFKLILTIKNIFWPTFYVLFFFTSIFFRRNHLSHIEFIDPPLNSIAQVNIAAARHIVIFHKWQALPIISVSMHICIYTYILFVWLSLLFDFFSKDSYLLTASNHLQIGNLPMASNWLKKQNFQEK